WIADDRPPPRLVVVQAAGCAPVVRAWEAGESATAFWEGAATIAAGGRGPRPAPPRRGSRGAGGAGGAARAGRGGAAGRGLGELGRRGLWICPEGAALLPAVRRLREAGWIRAGERVVLLNTGAGLVYPDVLPET